MNTPTPAVRTEIRDHVAHVTLDRPAKANALDVGGWHALRDAFRAVFALSSVGNKRFQDGEPWKGVKENPEATADLIWNLVYLVRDLAVLTARDIPGENIVALIADMAHRIRAMPGVPTEMHLMWEQQVKPRLRERSGAGMSSPPVIKTFSRRNSSGTDGEGGASSRVSWSSNAPCTVSMQAWISEMRS